MKPSFQTVFDTYYASTKNEVESHRLLRSLEALGTLDPKVVIRKLRARGLSNASINRHLSMLRRLVDVPVPCLKEGQGRTRVLSFPEEQELLEAADPTLVPLIVVLIDTGLRLGEALRLEPRDVLPTGLVVRTSKNGESRTVGLTARAREALTALPFPYRQDQVTYLWNKARGSLGLRGDPEYVPHMLRHTCATRLIQAGVGLPVVQRWMGHRNIQTTMRYAHVGDQEVLDSACRLEASRPLE